MRGIRSVAVAMVVIAMIMMGGGALAGSGGLAPRGFDRPSGAAPFSELTERDDLPGAPDQVIELFGQQEADEVSYISVDGRVFTGNAEFPSVQFPGTAVLHAELSGENEVDEGGTPGAGDPDGTGSAQIELTFDAPEVCATLMVADIALPAAAAHIHEGAAGVNGPVVITLPTPGEDGTAEGCVTEGVTTELLEEIAANPAGYYVNVHNALYPTGAVRGQLAQDPDAVIRSPGERFVFRERLFALDDSDPDNPRPTGEQIGTVLGECTTTTTGEEAGDFSLLCSRLLTLDGRGDIVVAESYTFADPLDDTLAITGGTGGFRDAGGQVAVTVLLIEGSNFSNSAYRIELLRMR